MSKASNIKTYLLLHGLMLLFSLSPVCSKLAGQQSFLSFRFFLFYGLVIVILGIYAILWQQVIKRMSLTAAYANKAVTVVWGMFWGAMLFGEEITLQKCIGAVVIVAGIILYAFSEQKEAKSNE
ncbi:EamA family transporter [uncultured Ruthenibacterium sp.]|uniref:EamA family transporter n=1 Tax=uncultured Ruthenibacterium sp. TaxID=1905347 RepID=UPI00349EF6D4